MKLTELDHTSTAEVVPDLAVGPIHVARLPRAGIAKPPALRFVTDEARPRHINSRSALFLTVGVMMVAFLWVWIDSSPSGRPSRSHRAPLRLSPAEQRLTAAARARAAAIAQARRDRGTDAQWQDTIPAAP